MLKSQMVLEAGLWVVRFSEHQVIFIVLLQSFDLSNALNISHEPNYQIAQVSIYDIPYLDVQFDAVI